MKLLPILILMLGCRSTLALEARVEDLTYRYVLLQWQVCLLQAGEDKKEKDICYQFLWGSLPECILDPELECE